MKINFHGAAVNNNKFENSFQHFELERESSIIFKHESENPQTSGADA